ncbi:glycoside hydrolase family 28 protein [Limosilactobacillus sp. STM2_1]|uniref:Glycoside hydrolase family 28 protein n=1 Tax=Limosilactobacillus rudii TaxID=2759755 RepID=A0A7W3YLT9_9LACO|nr:glycoside hydrolase family 28 protein [Limosilactobacillus rudii]MBB1078668.1 glycoside hydrolase family 28 protein [Limosilactobacillus rudii]MBB1096764.1 glycoside hydrolase family 28 protein [Limosilactobacillus rudii]MCD7135564.1 glycoside hydrolase family 28 protein [Limosilactobacillus rudii]
MIVGEQPLILLASNQNEDKQYIQKAINQLKNNNGGHLILSGGTFYTGALQLCSNLHLTIEANAKLVFSDDRQDYPVITSRWEGRETSLYRACLFGDHVNNIIIDGTGVINGNGFSWWEEFRKKNKQVPHARPYLLSIEHSHHIKIKDLQFINSPSWTLHPFDCHDCLIDGIYVKNPSDSPNTDGIDPESCQNLRIVNSVFDVGDDCIAIKAGTEDAMQKLSCENVVISNCNMLHGHGGVVLGSEMSGDIRNIVINNCTFTNTDRGIRFKTRRGRGGTIENIVIANISMNNILCPIVMNLYYFCGEKGKDKIVWDKEPHPVSAITPAIKHVRISQLSVMHIRSCAGLIYGLPEMPIEDVSISNSSFYFDSGCVPAEPAMFADAPKLTQKGFFIENTKDCELTNITMSNNDDPAVFHNTANENLTLNL